MTQPVYTTHNAFPVTRLVRHPEGFFEKKIYQRTDESSSKNNLPSCTVLSKLGSIAMDSDSEMMIRHRLAQGYLNWSQRPRQRVLPGESMSVTLGVVWPRDRWCPPRLLAQDALRRKEPIRFSTVICSGNGSGTQLHRNPMTTACHIIDAAGDDVSLLARVNTSLLNKNFADGRSEMFFSCQLFSGFRHKLQDSSVTFRSE